MSEQNVITYQVTNNTNRKVRAILTDTQDIVTEKKNIAGVEIKRLITESQMKQLLLATPLRINKLYCIFSRKSQKNNCIILRRFTSLGVSGELNIPLKRHIEDKVSMEATVDSGFMMELFPRSETSFSCIEVLVSPKTQVTVQLFLSNRQQLATVLITK